MTFLDTPLVTRRDLRLRPVALDLYRDVHKGLRALLFSVTAEAGALDPGDEVARRVLHDRVRELAGLLDSHAHHEDVVVQPALEQQLPALAERIEADHAVFDRRVLGLVSLAEEAAATVAARAVVHELYLGLAAFTASYLGHIDLEERVVMPALAEVVGLDGVVAMHEAIVSSIPPAEMARALTVMLPAMNRADRAELVAGMAQGAPAEVVAGVLGLADGVLPAADAAALRAAVPG